MSHWSLKGLNIHAYTHIRRSKERDIWKRTALNIFKGCKKGSLLRWKEREGGFKAPGFYLTSVDLFVCKYVCVYVCVCECVCMCVCCVCVCICVCVWKYMCFKSLYI